MTRHYIPKLVWVLVEVQVFLLQAHHPLFFFVLCDREFVLEGEWLSEYRTRVTGGTFAHMDLHEPVIECVKLQDRIRHQKSSQWPRAESLYLQSRLWGSSKVEWDWCTGKSRRGAGPASNSSSSFSSSSYSITWISCRKGKSRRGSGLDVSEMCFPGLASIVVPSLICIRTQSSNASSFKIPSGVRNRLNGPGQKVFICRAGCGWPYKVEWY